MLLLVIVVILVICLLVAFVKSALILLPWTITAAVLAGLSGMGLGMLAKTSRASGTAISVLSSFGLTFGFGYLGNWLIHPLAPEQKHGLEAVLDLPNPSQADLSNMFPIHLGITAVLCALVVSRLWYNWSPNLKDLSKRNAVEPPVVDAVEVGE